MAVTADFLHEPIRSQYSIRMFSDLFIQFLFNKLEKVDSFLFPLFNSVKKRQVGHYRLAKRKKRYILVVILCRGLLQFFDSQTENQPKLNIVD